MINLYTGLQKCLRRDDFRNHKANFLCCFAENIGTKSAFMAEICGAMRAIELANCRNWKNLWLESNSTLVVMAFKSSILISTLGAK
jgi:hypothetical protein